MHGSYVPSVSPRRGYDMADERTSDRDVEAMRDIVVVAAYRYRDAMRRYMGEQAAAVESGASLDELVRSNWSSFEEAARAEEELFSLLDRLDAMPVSDEHGARARHGAQARPQHGDEQG